MMLTLAVEVDQFGLMMFSATAVRAGLLTVYTEELTELTSAMDTMMMLDSSAWKVCSLVHARVAMTPGGDTSGSHFTCAIYLD